MKKHSRKKNKRKYKKPNNLFKCELLGIEINKKRERQNNEQIETLNDQPFKNMNVVVNVVALMFLSFFLSLCFYVSAIFIFIFVLFMINIKIYCLEKEIEM